MSKLRNYNGESFNGLTVAGLRELLDGQPDDAVVVFTSDYGDYHHTQQALPLRQWADATLYDAADVIEKSGYSHSGFAFSDPDERDDEDGSDEDLTDEELDELKADKEDAGQVLVIKL